MNRKISIIVAVANFNAIGKEGKLLIYVPGDLARFKSLTMTHTIVMGRKTFESLPKGALPNRRNIVLTRDVNFSAEGCEIVHDLKSFLTITSPEETIFCIGGGEIYKEFLPYADTLYLTRINKSFPDADVFFPEVDFDEWKLVEEWASDPESVQDFSFSFLNYKRIN